MPNHCSNTLRIAGPREQLEAFKARATKREVPDYDLGSKPIGQLGFDFEGPTTDEPLNFHAFAPVPEAIQRAGFDRAGYNWQIQNWGTKWGAYDQEFTDHADSLEYRFTTAWSPPLAIIQTMSIQYPELEFVDEWHEEGGHAGIITALQGNVAEEDRDHPYVHQYDDEDDVVDLDDENLEAEGSLEATAS